MALPALAMSLGRVAMAGAVGGRGASTAMMATQLAHIGMAAKQAVDPLKGLASTLGNVLLGPVKAVTAALGDVAHLVGLFNPGIVTRFTLAINDTMAVIGSALVPVLQGATQWVRSWGDALASLLPVIQPLFNAIGQHFANLAQTVMPLFEAAAPFIQLFTDVMTELIRKMSIGMSFFVGVVTEVLNILAELFGLDSRFKKASSSGFAARQTKVSTVEQFARDVFASTAKNAFSRQGGGKQPNELLAEIKAGIAEGKDFAKRAALAVEAIWGWIQNRFKDAGKPGAGGQAVNVADRLTKGEISLDQVRTEIRRIMLRHW